MQSKAENPDEYIESLPEERKAILAEMRQVILKNIPKKFEEQMGYGMPGFVVPHSVYPAGYHCDPKQPLPFLGMASQKNHISFYHMGLYAHAPLMEWFREEWPKHSKKKLDVGKSCVRFKKPEDVPLALIGKLVSKMSADQWIEIYERELKR